MQVKREMFMTIPAFIKATFGQEKYEKWLSLLKPETANRFKTMDLKENWYDSAEYFIKPLEEAAELFYSGNAGLAGKEHGIYDMKTWLTGPRAALFKLLPLKFMLENVFPSTLHRYYRIVDVKKITLVEGFAVFAVLGIEPNEAAVIQRFAGALEVYLRLKGYSDIRSEIAFSNNDVKLYCIIEIRYK